MTHVAYAVFSLVVAVASLWVIVRARRQVRADNARIAVARQTIARENERTRVALAEIDRIREGRSS